MSYFDMDRGERAKRTAWQIAHGIECDLGYYLMETDSRNVALTPHAIKMIFQHLLSEIGEIKERTKDVVQP